MSGQSAEIRDPRLRLFPSCTAFSFADTCAACPRQTAEACLRDARRVVTEPYATLVVDPPWPQKGAGALRGREGWHDSTGSSKPMPYPTMTVDQIAAMPIGDCAAPDAHLYLWTTNRFLPDAYRLTAAWGFKASTLLVWAKKPMGGGLGGAFGLATEYVLFARRGKLATTGRIGRNWFDWKRPYDDRGKPRHSAKPPAFFELVEQISPGPYLEVFARDNRLGWDAWGNEVPDCADLPALLPREPRLGEVRLSGSEGDVA